MRMGMRASALSLAICQALLVVGCSTPEDGASEAVSEVHDAPIGIVAQIVPGALAGAFKTSAQGAATYSVRVQAPPGTAGMQPDLSLVYSSGAGAGLLGQGWSLSGLSAISRCAQTIAQDGKAGRIAYDVSDRFCLDGVRLVQTGSGVSNGAAYWEYRTEVESFSRIRAFASTSGPQNTQHNPEWWEVVTRTGQTLLFGTTNDSRIEAQIPPGQPQRTDVRVYGLAKAVDRKGNYLTVSYKEESAIGEFYPTRIDYTGNAAAGLTPSQSIVFSYETRPDAKAGYVSGDLVSSTKRLVQITTQVGADVARSYRVAYTQGLVGRSLVSELQECGADNRCYPATQFSYAAGSDGLKAAEDWGSGHTADERSGDFNGDGVSDLVDVRGGTAYVSLSTRTTFLPAAPWGSGLAAWVDIQPLDLDADGKTDLLQFNGDGTATARLSTGTAFGAARPWGASLAPERARNLLSDVDADGRPDLLRIDANGDVWVALGTSSGMGAFYRWARGTDGDPAHIRMGDYDGDGRADLMSLVLSGGAPTAVLTPRVWLAEKGAFRAGPGDVWGNPLSALPGISYSVADVNGDGRDDLITKSTIALSPGGVISAALSSGRGFLPAQVWGSGMADDKSSLLDLNGDGLADVARFETGSDLVVGMTTALNSGTGFQSLGAWGALDPKTTTTVIAAPACNPAAWRCDQQDANIYCHNAGYTAAVPNGFGCQNLSCPGSDTSNPTITKYVWARLQCYRVGAIGMQLGDFNGDGRVDAVMLKSMGGKAIVAASEGNSSDMLVGIANGLGHRVEIDYGTLTDSAVYARDASVSYPDKALTGGVHVVRWVGETDGVTTNLRDRGTWFSYRNGKINLAGRGFAGFGSFQSFRSTGVGAIVSTETRFHQSFPYIGTAIYQAQRVQSPFGLPRDVSTTENFVSAKTYPSQPVRYFPFTAQTLTGGRDLTGTSLPTTLSTNTYDDEGNLVESKTVSGGVTTRTQNVYLPIDTARWISGRLSRTKVTKSDATSSLTRTSAFAYDSTTGLLTSETVEPDDATLRMTTAYVYDAFGNRTRTTVSAAGAIDRVSERQFDPKGRLVVTETNAKKQTTQYFYEVPRHAVPTRVVDANALVSRKSYDSLGRALTETRNDGVVTTFAYEKLPGVTKYNHPSRSCSNGPNTCSTPVRPTSDSPLPTNAAGAASDGCSFGYWGTDLRLATSCQGNAVNGRCPSGISSFGPWTASSPARGSFDFAEGFVYKVHTPALLCYPANVPVGNLGGVYAVTSSTPGAPTLRVTVDVLGREVKREVQGFDGRMIVEESVYNADGRVEKKSLPYFGGDTPAWITMKYDALGRVVETRRPDGAVVAQAYDGLQTTITNAKGQVIVQTKNAQGLLVSAKDALMALTTYRYDPFGNLVETKDPAGNVTIQQYDVRGRRTSLTDPDMGLVTYEYDGLGDLRAEVNPVLRAAGQKVTYAYDALARMVSRDDGGVLSTWTYDTCAKGVGQLCATSSPGYNRTLTYDTLGRLSADATTIHGTAFTTRTTYTADSRVNTVTYPSGLRVENRYNARGYLESVWDPTPGVAYWRATAVDARSQITGETLGNGLVTQRTFDPTTGALRAVRTGTSAGPASVQDQSFAYDLLSNVTDRNDAKTGLSEHFDYDSLNRLVKATPVAYKGAAPASLSLAYNALGNITSKSDVGAYLYGTRPHAVTSAGGNTYDYDANGNLRAGGGRTITWTSYDMPLRITSPSGAYSEFSYGPERQRIRQVSGSATTLYVSSLFERVTTPTTSTDKHYVFAGKQLIAQVSKSAAGTVTRYMHQDHLGSVAVVTDASAAVVERLSYDAFGKRRNADGSPATAIAIQSGVNRGFTGHEMLDAHGLIHMNARLYDPVLGRFLSADSQVQAPEFSQSFNRYSYVLNNPLSFRDPSGHFWGFIVAIFSALAAVASAIAAAIAAIAAAIAAAVTAIVSALAGLMTVGLLKAVVIGALMGFVMSGGSFKGMLMGAFTGAIFCGVGMVLQGTNIVVQSFAQGMIGGAMSVAQGGDFVSGFLGSAFSTLAGSWTKGFLDRVATSDLLKTCTGALSSVVVGGAASVLGGGKFENGAVSAAFRYAVGYVVDSGTALRTRGAFAYKDALSGTDFTKGVEESIYYDDPDTVAKPISGYQDVNVHADQSVFYVRDATGELQEVSPEALASRVRGDYRYQGIPIRLVACESAADGATAAQDFADAMWSKVLAPTTTVGIDGGGATMLEKGGYWRVITPRQPYFP